MLGKIRYWFGFVVCLIHSLSAASETKLLKSSDISKVMQQIFEQQSDQKNITESIFKHSFKVYIDQFDPERIYLLELEVRPFLELSDAAIARVKEQYQRNQFTEFMNLNDVIQKAIERSRRLRSGLERENFDELFQKGASYHVNAYDEWRDPNLHQQFSNDETDLRERIKQSIVRFIANARLRYGDNFVETHKPQVLRVFEKQMRSHENQYLFQNENGEPMMSSERDNAFSIHVLKALASSLDAHTSVLDSREAADMRLQLEKEIQGIGVVLKPSGSGEFFISELINGGPADKSGLIKPNDQIIEVDGIPISHMPLNRVMEKIRGKSGSTVSLLLKRSEEGGVDQMIPVQLVREEIPVNEGRVESAFETFGNGIIGKIKLDSFYQAENGVSSYNDLKDAIKKLDSKGNLRGLILDFRENSGGFLSQAIKVASLFITNGVIVISKYFNGEEHVYRDVDGQKIYNGPLIILTSKATASAAEIVAQALQDYGVALIVGDERTYGKGTIQSQTVTENQASTYFKVTVGKYYTVSGRTPQIQGVKADIVVPSQFAHENIGERYLDYALQQDIIPPEYQDTLQDITPSLKPWYLHYYIPTLQHKEYRWIQLLPALKKNSSYRIAHNKNYQAFLKGTNAEEEAAAWKEEKNFGKDDLQMAEAVNIMKDMIILHSQNYGTEESTKNPLQQPAGIFQ